MLKSSRILGNIVRISLCGWAYLIWLEASCGYHCGIVRISIPTTSLFLMPARRCVSPIQYNLDKRIHGCNDNPGIRIFLPATFFFVWGLTITWTLPISLLVWQISLGTYLTCLQVKQLIITLFWWVLAWEKAVTSDSMGLNPLAAA